MKLPLASVFFTAAAIASPMAASALEDIPTTAINNGSFTTLVAALGAADLVEALSMSGPYTVFAPTDDAFDDLPDGLVTCLLKPEYDDVLKDILTYHVAPGRAFAGDIANGQMIVTLFDEETVLVSKDSSGVQINNANVVIPDVEATNGVIHAIDSVLVPESIDVIAFLDNCQEADQLQITDEVTCSYLGMSRSAGNWLRGPTHTCLCNGNGHWTSCYRNNDSWHMNSLKTITGYVVSTDELSTLTALIVAADAGLDAVLDDNNTPYTLFAPSNRAFENVPKEIREALFRSENRGTLEAILRYHVVPGVVVADDINDGTIARTAYNNKAVQAEKICFSQSGCDEFSLAVNDSYIVAADVEASNGVVHIIDQVLIPSNLNLEALLR